MDVGTVGRRRPRMKRRGVVLRIGARSVWYSFFWGKIKKKNLFLKNALGRISSIGGGDKTIRVEVQYYVCAVWLEREREKICMEIWMRRYRANAPAERRSDGGGWTMTVQGILSLHSSFSPRWDGLTGPFLSLSLSFSLDARIFYSEPWPIVVFVWQPRNDNHFHHIDSLFSNMRGSGRDW